jgi:hypothetical protein
MAEISVERTSAIPTAQSGFVLCAATLLCAVLLQKIALPGTGGIYPLSLFMFPAITAAAFLAGVLEINTTAFVWYALFVLMGTLSAALSPSPHVSVLSLGFLVVAQCPLIFRCVSSEISYPRVMNFLSMVGCGSALIGVLQFMGQFVVGVDVAFFMDKHLPESVTVTGYNSLIPLYWSSPVFKSNGVFFLEPSLFCQFLAVAVVAELLLKPKAFRLLILAAGLVSSYSGTGLTMLALFLPFYFLHHGHFRLFLFAAIVSLVLIFFGDAISIDAFTRRLSEFSDVQSSGWARFLSMFRVLQEVVFANGLTFFIGRGPGTVQEQFQQFSFYAFDPTWGKVIYEYGLIGSLVYFSFFYLSFCKGPKGLRFAVGYTYLFLGGYLLNASVLMQVAALVVWVRSITSTTTDDVFETGTPYRPVSGPFDKRAERGVTVSSRGENRPLYDRAHTHLGPIAGYQRRTPRPAVGG